MNELPHIVPVTTPAATNRKDTISCFVRYKHLQIYKTWFAVGTAVQRDASSADRSERDSFGPRGSGPVSYPPHPQRHEGSGSHRHARDWPSSGPPQAPPPSSSQHHGRRTHDASRRASEHGSPIRAGPGAYPDKQLQAWTRGGVRACVHTLICLPPLWRRAPPGARGGRCGCLQGCFVWWEASYLQDQNLCSTSVVQSCLPSVSCCTALNSPWWGVLASFKSSVCMVT